MKSYRTHTYWRGNLDGTGMYTSTVESLFAGVRVEVEEFADLTAVLAALDEIRESVVEHAAMVAWEAERVANGGAA